MAEFCTNKKFNNYLKVNGFSSFYILNKLRNKVHDSELLNYLISNRNQKINLNFINKNYIKSKFSIGFDFSKTLLQNIFALKNRILHFNDPLNIDNAPLDNLQIKFKSGDLLLFFNSENNILIAPILNMNERYLKDNLIILRSEGIYEKDIGVIVASIG